MSFHDNTVLSSVSVFQLQKKSTDTTMVLLDEDRKEALLKMGEIPLENEWTYWYDKYTPNLAACDYESNLQLISTVGTVQKFWSVYNNIDGPEKLGFRSNLHFMKKGIKPIWEDPHNEYGGSYNFKVNQLYSPIVWRNILLLMIGERVEDEIKNTVYGVSVSSRQQCDHYQIWTAHSNHTVDDKEVRRILSDALYPAEVQAFYFRMHKTHADFQKTSPNQSPTVISNPSSPLTHSLNDTNTPTTRQKITEENTEKVVADIEKMGLKEKKHTIL
ncbi:translation initiation factor eIF 4e-like domain-containing protein [Pilobolus umbonatus]|nr:translation initiation factor eIF 4e-like domain-containing protein [Pilobolus umbonatus]